MRLPPVHLSIVQPPAYVHALGLLDPARYLRYQLRRFGVEVTLGKNRLRADAVNFVFGAHLGFDPELLRRFPCLIVNLEQMGDGGASLPAAYGQLLRQAAVVDYEAANVPVYAADPADVPLVRFLHAPYLATDAPLPLEQRPIDLLFIGSMNDRRRAFIDRVEAAGITVTLFDQAVYGPERDQFIRSAKAVLNCHYYGSSRFEQVRAFQCLSLGTPVISERRAQTQVPEAFERAVQWLGDDELEDFFARRFATPDWYRSARDQLEAFAATDPVDDYAELMAFASGFHQAWGETRRKEVWRPRHINLGSGKDYKAGWLNVDVVERSQPDWLHDLSQPTAWPVEGRTRFGERFLLEAGSVEQVYANNVLEHVPDLVSLMSEVLALLKTGGRFDIEVPYESAPTAWQDPTHVRALNENSWIYYTQWFWYLGWFAHRFEIDQFSWLDTNLQPCDKAHAAFMRVAMHKVETTVHERTVARTMQPDFGALDEDFALPVPAPAGEVPA
jgi:SAM-dependent methyltransferase